MADNLTQEQRKLTMQRVRSKDTSPEMRVRRMVHRLGFRYRLHKKDLPGKPDLVFSRVKKVIFVNGCFWHSHPGCKAAKTPKSNSDYWKPKLARNKKRDQDNYQKLRDAGWSVLVIWECQTKDEQGMRKIITTYLRS